MLDGVRKDHKSVPPGQETAGPPVRPICYANESPNFRISHFLSKIITNYTDAVDNHGEVRSSEELRAAFEKYNRETDPEAKKRCRLICMDVEKLYPSMSKEQVKLAVMEMIMFSDLELIGFDWWEAAKYVFVMYQDSTDIEDNNLTNIIPRRVKDSRVKLTVNCLKNGGNDGDWIRGDTPDRAQIKSLIALTVCAGVDVTFSSHVYLVGDKIYLQMSGAPIGLELSCAVHRPFMMRWDRMFREKVIARGLKIILDERYVDDKENIIEARSEDVTDEALALELKEIADTVMPGIKMEVDVASRHSDGCLPILDMSVWLDGDGNIRYKHYSKPMASKLVIPERSAHPNSGKRSVHIAELVRRLCNTSRELDWDTYVAPVLSEYMARMRAAGYSQDYREHVLRNALAIYDAKLRKNDEGTVPLNRPKGYKKVERMSEKADKRKSWSRKGGFVAPIIVPSTPGGILAKMMRSVAEKEATPGLRFKVVEKGGKRLESLLSKPNPTASDHCVRKNQPRKECVGCNQPGGINNCQKSNVLYRYECLEDDCHGVYIGETSRNIYSRSLEHKSGTNSFIKKHQNECHDNNPPNMKVNCLKSFKDSLSRQVSEGLYIFKTQEDENIKLLNSKSEWRQPSLIEMRQEIVRREVGN